MKILELLPKGARQIRYIHPHYEYEEDDDGNVVDEYCVNEDTCTDVWYDCVHVVRKNKTPIYYRRRTSQLAKEDVLKYMDKILRHNSRRYEWDYNCYSIRIKRLGRRVIFVYDEKYMKNLWLKAKQNSEHLKKMTNLYAKKKDLFTPTKLDVKDVAIAVAERRR